MTKIDLRAKKFLKYLFLLCFGGSLYCGIETMYRGYSHWTMYLLGGICFICFDLISEYTPWETPLWQQMLLGGLTVTVLEFITGCIVNLWLGWNVWHYSNQWNILGQISLPSSIAWCFLSLIGIILVDYIRYYFFGEEKPRYKFF
jgi:uncharacterized membrane protein